MTIHSAHKVVFIESLLTKSGWINQAYVLLDPKGVILDIGSGLPSHMVQADLLKETIRGYVIPGFQNAHSHAFQYAMAGIAEHLPHTASQDDFWTWREAMYSLAMRLDPDEMEAIATMLYAEMLRHGITAVTEFHYLQNDTNGRPYNNIAELGSRILAAAKTTGIHVTLVPVMYEEGGFGRSLTKGQTRFNTFGLSGYAKLLDATRAAARGLDDVIVGKGIHSLRAVSTEDTLQLLSQGTEGPIHLHIAEQTKEVDDCVAYLKKRPVEWLLDNLSVDHRYHLVHATHMTRDEAHKLGQSKATVVLCPSTEGNLGDGIFRLHDYRSAGGGCAIGTDSQIGLSPFEELRWLDYVQRLTAQKRNVVCQKSGEDSGTLLLTEAWDHGRSAMGLNHDDFFAVGQLFDAVVVDPDHPVMIGKPVKRRIGALIYSGDPTTLVGTIRRGQWLVQDGTHRHDEKIKKSYTKAVQTLSHNFGN
jgi:formimidoylglutamate deiminase